MGQSKSWKCQNRRKAAPTVPGAEDRSLKILCEDHNGTHVLPFLCRWHGGASQNVCPQARTIPFASTAASTTRDLTRKSGFLVTTTGLIGNQSAVDCFLSEQRRKEHGPTWIAITAVLFAISLCFSIGATLALQSARYY